MEAYLLLVIVVGGVLALWWLHYHSYRRQAVEALRELLVFEFPEVYTNARLRGWLEAAATGLAPGAQRRVVAEIAAHYGDARAEGALRGDILAGLGDARAAARAYGRVYLTRREADRVAELAQPRRMNYLYLPCVLFSGEFLRAQEAGWATLIGPVGGVFLCCAAWAVLHMAWLPRLARRDRTREALGLRAQAAYALTLCTAGLLPFSGRASVMLAIVVVMFLFEAWDSARISRKLGDGTAVRAGGRG